MTPPVVNEVIERPPYAGSSEATEYDNEGLLSVLPSIVVSPPIDNEYSGIPSIVVSPPSGILSNDYEPAAPVSRIFKRQAYGYSKMSGWNASPTVESPTWGEAWGSLTSTVSSAWDSTNSAWESTKSWWQGDNYASSEVAPIAVVEPMAGYTPMEPMVPATPANGGLWDSVKDWWKGDTAASATVAPVVSIPDFAAPAPPTTNTGIWGSFKNWWGGDSAAASPAVLDIPSVPEISEEPKNGKSEWSWLSKAKNWWKCNESPEVAIPEIPIPDFDLPIPNFEAIDPAGSMKDMPEMPAPPEIAPSEIPFSPPNSDMPLPSVDTLPPAEVDNSAKQHDGSVWKLDEDGMPVWTHEAEVPWTLDEDGMPQWLGDPGLADKIGHQIELEGLLPWEGFEGISEFGGEAIQGSFAEESPMEVVDDTELAGLYQPVLDDVSMESLPAVVDNNDLGVPVPPASFVGEESLPAVMDGNTLPATVPPPVLNHLDKGYTPNNNDLSTAPVLTDKSLNFVGNGFLPFSGNSAPSITSPTAVQYTPGVDNLQDDDDDQDSIYSFDFSHSDNFESIRPTYDSDLSFKSELPDSSSIYGHDSELPESNYDSDSVSDAGSIWSDDHIWSKPVSSVTFDAVSEYGSIWNDDHIWSKPVSPMKAEEVFSDDELPDAYDPYDVPVRGFIPIPPSTNELFGWNSDSDSVISSDYDFSWRGHARDDASSIYSTDPEAYGSDVTCSLTRR